MNPTEQIDYYIQELPDWKKEVVTKLRRFIHEVDPKITEEWKWGTPVFSHKGLLFAIGVFSDHVKLNFFQGAALPDVNSLFNSGLESKKTRAIDFNENFTIDEQNLKALLHVAVLHNIDKVK